MVRSVCRNKERGKAHEGKHAKGNTQWKHTKEAHKGGTEQKATHRTARTGQHTKEEASASKSKPELDSALEIRQAAEDAVSCGPQAELESHHFSVGHLSLKQVHLVFLDVRQAGSQGCTAGRTRRQSRAAPSKTDEGNSISLTSAATSSAQAHVRDTDEAAEQRPVRRARRRRRRQRAGRERRRPAETESGDGEPKPAPWRPRRRRRRRQ